MNDNEFDFNNFIEDVVNKEFEKQNPFNMKQFVEDYHNGKVKIGVELMLAKRFFFSINDKKIIYWNISLLLLPLIIISILSIWSLGLLGIIYTIIIEILLCFYLGICSTDLPSKKIINLLSYIISFLSIFIFSLKIIVLIIFTALCFISIYEHYNYIRKAFN